MAFDYYRERMTDRGRIKEFEGIAHEGLYNLLDELLEVAVREIGSLSTDSDPRREVA